ncbi:MAG: hypothetical protein L6Q76_35390, partial [Polyangiaceae bacterium]|nr:hypothetical protein [Polyangiaceae bacterium]
MKRDSALVSISLVLSIFALTTCTTATDDIFNDGDVDYGEGGSSTNGAGSGGPILAGTGGTGGGGSGSGSGSGTTSTGGPILTGGAGGGGGEGGSGGSGGSGPVVDCDNIPEGPFPYTVKLGQKASEDMDFDNAGNLVGADNGNLFKSTFDGQSQIWVPGAGDFIAGLRFTSFGVLVYANVSSNSLFRVIPPASKAFVIGGLSYPNGMDADNNGNIVVAEQNASQVRRVNPENGEFDILGTNMNNPNGVSFSPDYKTLYVGSFGGGMIYKITLDAQDKPVSQSVFIQGFSQN